MDSVSVLSIFSQRLTTLSVILVAVWWRFSVVVGPRESSEVPIS